jgi:hypothetical protein
MSGAEGPPLLTCLATCRVRAELEDALLDTRDEVAVLQARLRDRDDDVNEQKRRAETEKEAVERTSERPQGGRRGGDGGSEAAAVLSDKLKEVERRLKKTEDELRLERGLWKARNSPTPPVYALPLTLPSATSCSSECSKIASIGFFVTTAPSPSGLL